MAGGRSRCGRLSRRPRGRSVSRSGCGFWPCCRSRAGARGEGCGRASACWERAAARMLPRVLPLDNRFGLPASDSCPPAPAGALQRDRCLWESIRWIHDKPSSFNATASATIKPIRRKSLSCCAAANSGRADVRAVGSSRWNASCRRSSPWSCRPRKPTLRPWTPNAKQQ